MKQLTSLATALVLAAAGTSANAGSGVRWAVDLEAPAAGGGRVAVSLSNAPRLPVYVPVMAPAMAPVVLVQPAPVWMPVAQAPVMVVHERVVWRERLRPYPVVVTQPVAWRHGKEHKRGKGHRGRDHDDDD